jgi:hypothetical protein
MSTKTKTTSSNTPWAPAQPYITSSLSALQGANQQGQANLNANMGGLNAAIANVNQSVAAPPAYLTDARSQLDKTINGDFVNSNPYTSDIANQIAAKTGAQYNSTFGAAGRSHGGLAALLSGQGVGDALQNFYSNQYNTERGLQQQAMMAAPGFHQDQAGTDINALLPGIQASAMLPGQVAGQYAGGVAGATSPYVQNTTTQKTGGLGQILSTGLGLAAQVGGAFMGMPPGLGAGGGLGGLAGLINPSQIGNFGGPITSGNPIPWLG